MFEWIGFLHHTEVKNMFERIGFAGVVRKRLHLIDAEVGVNWIHLTTVNAKIDYSEWKSHYMNFSWHELGRLCRLAVIIAKQRQLLWHFCLLLLYMLPPWTPFHLSPSFTHLFASPRLSRQSNNLYLEATGPREAAEGEPKELAIVAN